MDQLSELSELNEIDISLQNSTIIRSMQDEIVELKMQHNALVRTTSRKSDVKDKIPGYSFLDALWKKAYYANIVKDYELYKVKLFAEPGEKVSGANEGADVGGGKTQRKEAKVEKTQKTQEQKIKKTLRILFIATNLVINNPMLSALKSNPYAIQPLTGY